ncbi:MAG: glycosyltransferase family A protein [Pseudomonadota bacterium]
MPAISLILATFGRTAELQRLFDSLAVQTCRDFEVIVVDQNADDRLISVVGRARELGIVTTHLKHHPPNLAAARNAGIELARAPWIGFPDDDCWYDPALLQRLVIRSAAADEPQGIIVRWVEQGEPAVTAHKLSWTRSRAFRDVPVSSITLFIQRRLLNRIGGFDSRLGVGQWFGAAEETDLVLRALRIGATMAYEPSAHVHHAVDPPQPGANAQDRLAARQRARGTGALYAKHNLPAWVIARGLVAPLLRPMLKGSFGSDLAHGCAVMRGRLDGLLGWKCKKKTDKRPH